MTVVFVDGGFSDRRDGHDRDHDDGNGDGHGSSHGHGNGRGVKLMVYGST